MDWTQFAIFIITMGGMFLWLRSESRADRSEAAADRRDILQIIRDMEQENKDFHARMAVLEERYLQILVSKRQ